MEDKESYTPMEVANMVKVAYHFERLRDGLLEAGNDSLVFNGISGIPRNVISEIEEDWLLRKDIRDFHYSGSMERL